MKNILRTGFLKAGMRESLLMLPSRAAGRVKLKVRAVRQARVVAGNSRLMLRTPKCLIARLVTNNCINSAMTLVVMRRAAGWTGK